jgi:hypothetical protein
MEAACRTRDDAEALWRGAEDPAPPAVRLSRAQAKLDRAVAIQAESRRAILELEKAHKARLEELHAKLGEDTERVRHRRMQLGAIQDELAAGGSSGKARAKQGQAVQEVHSVLCGTVAPAIASLVEQLDSSAPAWGVLNGLLGTISNSSALLEGTIAPQPTARNYHIGDDEEEWDDWGRDEGREEGSEWSESHELGVEGNHWGQAGSRGGDQGEAWEGDAGAQAGGGDADQPMGTGAWWEMPRAEWEAGTRWQECGHGKWARTRASWADSWEDERAREEEGAAQPPAARRRLEPAPPAQPRETKEGGDGQGEAAEDPERRSRLHSERVQRIVTAAIEAGIQPLTGAGEELQVLDANQLDAWAAENLPANGHGW